MYILGISCYYHDSSACLIEDGKIVAAVEEERFTRKKHDNSFPHKAIEYCLYEASITIEDIDEITFYEVPSLKFHRIISQHLLKAPRTFNIFRQSFPQWILQKLDIKRMLKNELGYKGSLTFVDHHMSHASSAFYPSPFKKAAILTVDGVGEWATTAYGYGEDNKLVLEKKLDFPHSIGLLYSTITNFLGFSVNNSEYKVMGLSAYGNTDKSTNKYYSLLNEIIDVKEDGSFKLDMSFFDFESPSRMYSIKLVKHLGVSPLKNTKEISTEYYDLAAAVQIITEEVLFRIINYIHSIYKTDNLVMAGGVALNSLANGKIISNTPFKKIFIQPASGDGGTSLGSALYYYHHIKRNKNRMHQEHSYFGPSFENEFLKGFLESHGIKYKFYSDIKELINLTANLLYENNVIGWFQGRMEWGPRALGARSILSNPCNPDMQTILNEKVKHREKFRPFAPVICEDDAHKYFDMDEPVPEPTDYMLMVYPIKSEFHNQIPAVTHVDGTGRLQTIRRKQNSYYYDLVKAFGKLSGIPILINTSFNIRGEPIVCTPKDAYRCMMGTGIDYLVMGNFLISREENPKDMWDSESLAVD